MPGKRARPVLWGPWRGDASGLPDWRIWYYLLEAAGLDVQLVNAREVKNVPGRAKTDKLDAVWLAKLTEKGLLRPSFVPPAPIRRLRDYTRLRTDLTTTVPRQVQRLEKLLEDTLIEDLGGSHRHHGRVRTRHDRGADRRTANRRCSPGWPAAG